MWDVCFWLGRTKAFSFVSLSWLLQLVLATSGVDSRNAIPFIKRVCYDNQWFSKVFYFIEGLVFCFKCLIHKIPILGLIFYYYLCHDSMIVIAKSFLFRRRLGILYKLPVLFMFDTLYRNLILSSLLVNEHCIIIWMKWLCALVY